MKQHLIELLRAALELLKSQNVITEVPAQPIALERTRQKEHGDFASNVALGLAKANKMKPRELAEKIVQSLPHSDLVAKTEIAGPGFINFFLQSSAMHSVVRDVLAQAGQYGRSQLGANRRIMVEFVSANPNGPLHVGHGRGAAYGDSLARLLAAAGFRVHREYYVNDAGRQMDILAVSVWVRYLELGGVDFPFPTNGYKGDYVFDIAASLRNEHKARFEKPVAEIGQGLPDGEPAGGDKEVFIDALIERARRLLGDKDYELVHAHGLNAMLADIRSDLKQFGVEYDEWFSEKSLMTSGAVERAIALLRKNGHLYENDGAVWFRSTAFGDEKDRVVVRENGVTTYFASDIAYHLNKVERGFEHAINVWGADHHGYIPRVRAALSAMDKEPNWLTVLLVQFAILYRGGQRAQMSTRSGEFVTLRELRSEVGNDAARFFYVLRKSEQHMDFDLDLAKSQSTDNPVYYIQYAHARICSVFRQMREKGLAREANPAQIDLSLLKEEHEIAMLNTLSRYPEVLEEAAKAYEPHQIAYYLRELANDLHTYYNAHTFLLDDVALRNARLCLIDAARQVIANGLALLGVSAPESM